MFDVDGGFGGRTVELFLVVFVASVGFGGYVAVVAVGIVVVGGWRSVGVISGVGVAGRGIFHIFVSVVVDGIAVVAVVVFGSTPCIPKLDTLISTLLHMINPPFLYPYQLLQVLLWHHLAPTTLLVGAPRRYVY